MVASLSSRVSLASLLALIVALLLSPGLFAQSNPGPISLSNMDFETGSAGQAPPGWAANLAGESPAPSTSRYDIALDPKDPRRGKMSVRLGFRGETPTEEDYGVASRSVDAAPYRGSRIRLSGAVRTKEGPGSHVGLWMRVDTPERPAFFDNMSDRPIRDARWARYEIVGDVPPSATRIVFGLLVSGADTAWLDDVRLEVVGPARRPLMRNEVVERPRIAPGPGDEPARALGDRELRNLTAFARLYGYLRYFHPSDEAVSADWNAVALAGVDRVAGAENPAALAAALNAVFKPLAPNFEAFVTGRAPAGAPAFPRRPSPTANAVRWRHAGTGDDGAGIYKSIREEVAEPGPDSLLTLDLDGGVSSRVPLLVWRDASAKTLPRAKARVVTPRKPAGFTPSGLDRTTRLADVVIAWNAFQHFYPYFDVVKVDWPAELTGALRAAATDKDDFAFHRTLRRLVAALDDGHGRVIYATEPRGLLPLAWEDVEGKLVITAAAPGAGDVRRGDVVTHIDGVPVADRIAETEQLFSGSPQWVRWRALGDLLGGSPNAEAELRLQGADGAGRNVRLAYRPADAGDPVREKKPEAIAELAPGILYVDLDSATDEQMAARQKDIAAASGLIFDVRGYPKPQPKYLEHLTDKPIKSARMEVPIFLKPDRAGVTHSGGGWNMMPAKPRFTSNIVFITNGSAISYAESVLGVVRGNSLGDILGEPTAGANGNVTSIRLPGGYVVAWTGMRVVNLDGSQHHIVGVKPTIPASRTLDGVRAGKDELLERALATVKAKLAAAPAGPARSPGQ